METGLENIRYPAFCFHSYTRSRAIFTCIHGDSLAMAFIGAFRRSTLNLEEMLRNTNEEALAAEAAKVEMVVILHHSAVVFELG